MKLSDRLKELRNQHGLSQEELARRAGLSLRTIQRIELDETEPRGDTLIRITGVFNLKPNDILKVREEGKSNFVPLLNFSALTFFAFPFLGFLTPLLFWLLKKGKSETEKLSGRKLLNFEITWSIITCSVYFFGICGKILDIGKLGRPESLMVSILVLYLLNFIFILFNIFLSVRDKRPFYQPAIPFLR